MREADQQIVALVQECYNRYSVGKMIIYSASIVRVKRLAGLMDCPAYFNEVPAKSDVFQRIISPDCHVVVATNALGLGIDIPNIRVVIHIDGIQHFRDFAQESGRAGRDGQRSESIVIQPARRPPHIHIQEGQKQLIDGWMAGTRCCRATLEAYLDGIEKREECQEGEEACWVCSDPPGPEESVPSDPAIDIPA